MNLNRDREGETLLSPLNWKRKLGNHKWVYILYMIKAYSWEIEFYLCWDDSLYLNLFVLTERKEKGWVLFFFFFLTSYSVVSWHTPVIHTQHVYLCLSVSHSFIDVPCVCVYEYIHIHKYIQECNAEKHKGIRRVPAKYSAKNTRFRSLISYVK